MRQRALVFAALMFALVGCSLSATGEGGERSTGTSAAAEVTTTNTAEPRPTRTPFPPATPRPTATAMRRSDTDSRSFVTCNRRTDWPVYTVAGGDTVASIARRTDSSINEIASANCLEDPSQISVGQQLHVPRLPDGPAPDYKTSGFINISSYADVDVDTYIMAAGSTVTLTWVQAPLDELTQVEFALWSEGAVSGTSLGIDDDLSDGASIVWTVPEDIDGWVIVSGRLPGQGHESRISPNLYVRSAADVDNVSDPVDTTAVEFVGAVTAAPVARVDGGWTVLENGAEVTLAWPEAPEEAEAVTFFLAPTGTGVTPSAIGSDENLSDGASVVWTVPGVSGHITAAARLSDGSRVETAQTLQIYSLSVNNEQPELIGQASVEPAERGENGSLIVVAGTEITLSWPEAPVDRATSVGFHLGDPCTSRCGLGSDFELADGASITWTPPATWAGRTIRFAALANLESGRTVSTSEDLEVQFIAP